MVWLWTVALSKHGGVCIKPSTPEQLRGNEFSAFVVSGWAIADVRILQVDKIVIIFELKQGVKQNSPTFGDSDWTLDTQMLGERDKGSSRPGARALARSESMSRDTECAKEKHKNVYFTKVRGDKSKLVQNLNLNKWEQTDYFILEKNLWLFPHLQEGAECLEAEESSLQNAQKKGANGFELLLWKKPNISVVAAVGRPGSRHIAVLCCCFFSSLFSRRRDCS